RGLSSIALAMGSGFEGVMHAITEQGKVFCEALFALYITASIMLILYYVLKYYREAEDGQARVSD
ncbi:hypothetical protein, partial [Serratia marcescens]|uniref:hypothetical protein n=1 Tax=Serratia marcescens TaxID=615 RepID=UPI0013DA13C8